MIKRPMANQMILYNKIGSHRPTQVTELPVESEYNIPSWNEMLYLKIPIIRETVFRMPCRFRLP